MPFDSRHVAPSAGRAVGRARRRFSAPRVIGALMLREMATRFGGHPGGVAWAVLQPLGVIVVLAGAFALMLRTPSLGTSFMLFKATGLMVFVTFRSVSQMVGRALTFSRPLLMYPGVTWADAVLARFVLNALIALLVTALILWGIVVYDDVGVIIDWGAVVVAMGLTLMLAFGWGVLNAFLLERFSLWDQIWGVPTAPLMLVSGVLVLFEDMPQVGRDILWFNPLMHLTGMMREGFYSTYSPTYLSVPLVLAFALLPMASGLVLLRRHARDLLAR